MSKLIHTKDLNFLLYQVFDAEKLTELNRYKEHDKTTFDSVLNIAQGIATDYFAPHYAKADQNEPIFDGTRVTTIPEIKTAWQQYAASGLLSAQHDYELGGMQLPTLIHMACHAFYVCQPLYSSISVSHCCGCKPDSSLCCTSAQANLSSGNA